MDKEKLLKSAISGIVKKERTKFRAELKLAEKPARRGILFVADCAPDAAGVLTAWAQWIPPEEATLERIKCRNELVCRGNFGKILREQRK